MARYPLIASTANAINVSSFVVDCEAVAVNETRLAVFDWLRSQRHNRAVFLYAFDLIELNRRDLKREPIEARKAALARCLNGSEGQL